MNLKLFCPRWGSEGLSWDVFMKKVKAAGYDGIEYAISNEVTNEELDLVWNKAEAHGLLIIMQHYATNDADFNRHHDNYATWFERLRDYKALKINSQTGRDIFSFEQNKALIGLAADYSENMGIDVCHETHRNKFSFAAHITKPYLTKIPSLKLTLDASHWVCVAETFLEDQQETMELALTRTEHIHARVGYTEGPQIPDPRDRRWNEAVSIHLAWWDKVIARKKKEKDNPIITITPEFGPPPYMVTFPFTRQPITSQWEVNEYMMNLLKRRYLPGLK
jgi:sugar phosphate isomerase/epimerase